MGFADLVRRAQDSHVSLGDGLGFLVKDFKPASFG